MTYTKRLNTTGIRNWKYSVKICNRDKPVGLCEIIVYIDVFVLEYFSMFTTLKTTLWKESNTKNYTRLVSQQNNLEYVYHMEVHFPAMRKPRVKSAISSATHDAFQDELLKLSLILKFNLHFEFLAAKNKGILT